MSLINNIENNPSTEQKALLDYKSEDTIASSATESSLRPSLKAIFTKPGVSYGSDQPYLIPLDQVKSEIMNTKEILSIFVLDLEKILRQVRLDPRNNPKLEEAHNYVWSEINKTDWEFPKIEVDGYLGDMKYPTPQFICFDQYLYAESVQTRGYRKFVKEYDNLISNSSSGHIYDFREIVKYLLSEVHCIQNSIIKDFGDIYEDDSQQQVATYYFYWCKMAQHYKELFAKSITTPPTGLPETEVDKATKKQAAQFQAFFSLKVNSLTTAIDSKLDSLHKDLVTNCEVFYSKFLGPSLRFKTKVAADLSVEIKTSKMIAEMPKLAEEASIALLAAEGNFKSVLTDLLERRNITSSKIDNLYQEITIRRKYISYISQLSKKATERQRVIATAPDDQRYHSLFSAIYLDDSDSKSLRSSHGLLDDLGDDSHPQYLLKSGGYITGDIFLEENASIDGVKIGTHSHTGFDGSSRIRSIDIDYDSVRREITVQSLDGSTSQINLYVDSYVPDILTGGVPVADVNIRIEVPDEYAEKYDFEILYTEL